MGFICTSHPSHPAVDVCDRCGVTLCGSCAIGDRHGRVWCGPCALGSTGVRRRHAPRAVSRRTVANRRRALRELADRCDPTVTSTDQVPDGTIDPAAGPSPWDRGTAGGWTRRF